ncbi:LOW QUALITY PROTEIN: hypothetical protein QYF61_000816 [Mycteria americana]|uniref:RNase H type-1 domain-containing protein n=1 Tax=Mycteria americana TaxID=33587 RepID=A0AAN7NTM1_MYCAM|nr:LOW QUALITY PROTEIN: hypothetical protein QYF61_000816 [Mycteria americana]
MALPGASGRKHQGRLEVDPWAFGVGDTEDLRPAILQLKNRYWQHMKDFEVLRKWLVLKHSSSWHPDCWCWAGCSKGGSPLHIMQLMLLGCTDHTTGSNRNLNHPGILEVTMDWPEGTDFGISPEEEYALFTDGSCRLLGKHWRWKAAVWSPIQQVTNTAEGESESSQFAEVTAIQLALDTAEREKWPVLCLCTDSWVVANALWGWLQQWKQSNWQHRVLWFHPSQQLSTTQLLAHSPPPPKPAPRRKPTWAAALWQGISAQVENLVVEVRHMLTYPRVWPLKDIGTTSRWIRLLRLKWLSGPMTPQAIKEQMQHTDGLMTDGVDLTMDTIAQVIHECETCATIKQAKRLKPLWYGGRWLK